MMLKVLLKKTTSQVTAATSAHPGLSMLRLQAATTTSGSRLRYFSTIPSQPGEGATPAAAEAPKAEGAAQQDNKPAHQQRRDFKQQKGPRHQNQQQTPQQHGKARPSSMFSKKPQQQ